MRERAHAVLDAAWAAGVRYFDTARSYGGAEEFLASWLVARGVAPQSVTVGSKWGYTYSADWQATAATHEVKDHSLAVLLRQISESRAVLGPQLDLYQIHSATLDSGVLDDDPVLEQLAQLRSEGLRIGLTLTGPRQADTLRRAIEVEVAGQRLFDTVQATWNVLEPSAGIGLQAAHDAGLGVIIKEALANGRLTSRNIDPTFAPTHDTLGAVAARLGTTIDALALAAALAQPFADVVLSGAATTEQLTSNLEALSVPRDERAAAELRALAEPPEAYWAIRSRMAWS